MGLVEVRLIGSRNDLDKMIYGLDCKDDLVSKIMQDKDNPGKVRVYITHYEE